MKIVIDSSIALSWYFEDEADPYAESVLDAVVSHGASVPFHWKAEVANGLLMGLRRKRITPEYREQVFEELSALKLSHDASGQDHVWSSVTQIADSHGLTIYDAIYVELALRRGFLLASLDKKLMNAAKAAGVHYSGEA